MDLTDHGSRAGAREAGERPGGVGADVEPAASASSASSIRSASPTGAADPTEPADDPTDLAGQEHRVAAQAVERELSVLFGRARSLSLALAAQVHPGLDAASYALLVHLNDTGAARAVDVVDRTGLDKSTVSRQLARLVELGLVERVADPSDGRARIVQLTEDGRRRLAEARTDRRRRLRSRLTSWSAEDMRTLSRLLGRLNDDL
ncbi:MarR family winged helix-turn-helix transcriptional regulator [Goodfellowiella coeruleoviolacea]|uniref:DNA-binding transcriptional regulator, MarR family n=1 Tax=Goodfellowiella coeruleoviolacea TaxID=334858 RepID=A0AAE3GMA0_9PSEU|nr:MarR family winged helix-turn-helix transcriptional regulator [Goodfellowiella coeruleoviolacea]MCP2169899.1 DNA-binding transcriptional regulator, MarR family [Goodfellowiella coeruleoviolacea]